MRYLTRLLDRLDVHFVIVAPWWHSGGTEWFEWQKFCRCNSLTRLWKVSLLCLGTLPNISAQLRMTACFPWVWSGYWDAKFDGQQRYVHVKIREQTGVQCAAGIRYLSNFEARNQAGVLWSIFLKSPATITLSLCLVCPAYMHAVFSYPEHVRKYWNREMKIGIDMNLGATWRSRLPILDIQFVLDHPWPAKGSWSNGPKKSLLKAYHRKTWPNYQFRKKRNNKQHKTTSYYSCVNQPTLCGQKICFYLSIVYSPGKAPAEACPQLLHVFQLGSHETFRCSSRTWKYTEKISHKLAHIRHRS